MPPNEADGASWGMDELRPTERPCQGEAVARMPHWARIVYLCAVHCSPPGGVSQQYHQYAYSNPVRWTDPSGQCVFVGLDTVACAGVVIVFLVAAGVTTWATYDACITRGGCEQLRRDILAWQAQGNRFDTGGVPVPVLSAPHGAPQPAPTPVPFPLPTEQARPIAVFPEASDCPPVVVVQPGPAPQQPTPVSASTRCRRRARGGRWC
jgi:hypothetical protein